jgi:hypothetical protein
MTQQIQAIGAFRSAPIFIFITVFLMQQALSHDFYLASLSGLISAFTVPASSVQLTLSLFILVFCTARRMVGSVPDLFDTRPALVMLVHKYWMMIPAIMFLTMGAHGINFPVSQSHSVSPFPLQTGTATALMGALYMTVAFVLGSIIGATHNGTVYPLAIIAFSMGLLIFLSTRILHRSLKVESIA